VAPPTGSAEQATEPVVAGRTPVAGPSMNATSG